MNKKEILDILDNAKDERGAVPMRLVRMAFDKLSEPCEDTISRQAAIDAIMHDLSYIRTHEFNAGATRATNRIKQLPSAQPEYEPVKAEDFAKTMSENTLYGFIAWHSRALELMERQGFVICKKTM